MSPCQSPRPLSVLCMYRWHASFCLVFGRSLLFSLLCSSSALFSVCVFRLSSVWVFSVSNATWLFVVWVGRHAERYWFTGAYVKQMFPFCAYVQVPVECGQNKVILSAHSSVHAVTTMCSYVVKQPPENKVKVHHQCQCLYTWHC